jgi:hypothetical protein
VVCADGSFFTGVALLIMGARMDNNTFLFKISTGILMLLCMVFLKTVRADYTYNYHDYTEMVAFLKNMEAEAREKTPNIFFLQVIGHSYLDNPVYAVKFSANPVFEDDAKPDVVIDAGIHGNEWLPVESTIYFIQHLFESYYNSAAADNAEVTDLVDNYEIWIIPMINVDGRLRDDLSMGDPEHFWTDPQYHPHGMDVYGDKVGWRMNVQTVDCPAMPGGRTVGIDINRTFSHHFWDLSDCAATLYNGGSPFAATESRVLKQFVNNHMVSLLLHQHTPLQTVFSGSGITGLGAYISTEVGTLFSEGLPDPRMVLSTELKNATGSEGLYQQKLPDLAAAASGVCSGSAFSGQYYSWLWEEIDCVLAPDNHSRRAIQSVFIEYPFLEDIYGAAEDGKIGKYNRSDTSNYFHPSSGEIVQWMLDRNVEIYKYMIKQSRYPFSPRVAYDMSRKPEAPGSDLALVGAKISEPGIGLSGCFGYDETDGRDLIEPGSKKVTWNVQNNGLDTRAISSGIIVCNLSDDPDCTQPVSAVLTRGDAAPEAVETFAYTYNFEPVKDYAVTITTGENNSYNNDLKRYVFRTSAASSPCPAVLASGYDADKVAAMREFRDSVLLKTADGKKCVQLFYRHAPELAALLAADPVLRSRAARVLNDVLPEVLSPAWAGSITLSGNSMDELERLCKGICRKAGTGLREAVRMLRQRLRRDRLFDCAKINAASQDNGVRCK